MGIPLIHKPFSIIYLPSHEKERLETQADGNSLGPTPKINSSWDTKEINLKIADKRRKKESLLDKSEAIPGIERDS